MKRQSRLFGKLLLGLTLCLLPGCASEPPAATVPAVVLPAIADIPQFSLPLSVTQAYQAIPHQRTEFDSAFSAVPAAEKAYLELMFPLIDQAIAVRVSTLKAYTSGDRTEDSLTQYQALIDFSNTVTPPSSMSAYHSDIVLALQAQKAFFQDWRAKSRGFTFRGNAAGNHPKVKTSSQHLRAAYDHLMNTFPQEDSINKSAFFDYHCALDFI
ncbi:MAG: hypothetical protein AAF635_06580 [Cyanobacteria bacterium P01_C01_bin.69]